MTPFKRTVGKQALARAKEVDKKTVGNLTFEPYSSTHILIIGSKKMYVKKEYGRKLATWLLKHCGG